MVMKMKNRTPFIPKYAILPVAVYVVLHILTYNITKIITCGSVHYELDTAFDEMIPLLTPFILFYVIAYVQWFLCYRSICLESREICYRYFTADSMAKIICLVAFIVFPTEITRPEITGNSVFDLITKFIYACDSPTNLFPSIHCLESWLCFRSAITCKKTGKTYFVVNLIFTVMVCASTVFVKQHCIVDVAAGICVGELCLKLTKLTHAQRIFDKLNKKLIKNY